MNTHTQRMADNSEQDILDLINNPKSSQRGFVSLVELYQQAVYWHIRRLVVSHEDAQDIMQETFINVYKYIDKFKKESSLKTWIYKIATNESIRHYKKKKLDVDSYDSENNRLLDMFEAEEGIDFASMEARLQRAILGLPQKQRIVFNLRHYEDMSYEQIAEVTESSVATLKTNYHYAVSKIKEHMLNQL